MAGPRLELAALSEAVQSEESVRTNAFSIAATLADEFGRIGDTPEFRSLLLTALEHRSAFGSSGEIIDALVREVGLFPYLDPQQLGLRDLVAYELHKPDNFPVKDVVFHGPQARVYWELMNGRSVVLSAPTSFGKSLIIDAVIGSGKYKNILIVVPTIALIDETRRRLQGYRTKYKVIAHPSQAPEDFNVYVLTQERVLELRNLDSIDFFVIDEFYKLSPAKDESSRSSILNVVFHRLATAGKQFYLLGPDIEGISSQLAERLQLTFIYEPYQTVASVSHSVRSRKGEEFADLVSLRGRLEGQTLVFCSSPPRAAKIAAEFLNSSTQHDREPVADAIDWISSTFHPDWHFVRALSRGVGVHHGRIPRALAHYVVKLFNETRLGTLICTSTLIEGVNTKARNIIVFDNKINQSPIDFFTFNNICGRSGRMFQHFVGHVYLFHPAPQRNLPFVDVPAFSQSDEASMGLLLQLEEGELTQKSRDRLAHLTSSDLLSVEALRRHPDLNPDSLISLAKEIDSDVHRFWMEMRWTFDPTYSELLVVCDLMWRHFRGHSLGSGSAFSHSQLATKILKLRGLPSTRDQIQAELDWAKDVTVDEAVRRVLDFNRLWVSFHFPRLLMAIQTVAHEVFTRRGLKPGDFSAFAARVETFFLSPLVAPLDEYGIPIDLTRKLLPYIDGLDLDAALATLLGLDVDGLPGLHEFERKLLKDALWGLGDVLQERA